MLIMVTAAMTQLAFEQGNRLDWQQFIVGAESHVRHSYALTKHWPTTSTPTLNGLPGNRRLKMLTVCFILELALSIL